MSCVTQRPHSSFFFHRWLCRDKVSAERQLLVNIFSTFTSTCFARPCTLHKADGTSDLHLKKIRLLLLLLPPLLLILVFRIAHFVWRWEMFGYSRNIALFCHSPAHSPRGRVCVCVCRLRLNFKRFMKLQDEQRFPFNGNYTDPNLMNTHAHTHPHPNLNIIKRQPKIHCISHAHTFQTIMF